mmetsp:Transcript_63444/g.174643  ORF Transcript_63444/g.174643 Transcript_63444/m.174643 type:complete len:248 (+) Transcript_63444:1587-2330(+)
MEMTATHTGTCEQSTSCNLYVVMVLHNPGEQREGGERDVFCDVHWFWSPGHIKGSTVHHKAMHIIKKHYTTPPPGGGEALVPGLQRIRLWTDGHPWVYKCAPNFGPMLYWPVDPASVPDAATDQGYAHADDCEIVHNFFEHDHASGPQDITGKVPSPPLSSRLPSPPFLTSQHIHFPPSQIPRAKIQQAVGYGNATNIYNYHECMKFCMECPELQAPSGNQAHRGGTWARAGVASTPIVAAAPNPFF